MIGVKRCLGVGWVIVEHLVAAGLLETKQELKGEDLHP